MTRLSGNFLQRLLRKASRHDSLPSRRCLKPLPSDIWLQIIRLAAYEFNISHLSSVNHFLREITKPLLFNPVVLCRLSPRIATDDDLPCLEDVVERIRGINSSPHILNVIHQLTLFEWSFPLQDQAEDVDSDTTDEEDEDSLLIRSSYRALSELILNVPNPCHFECRDCTLPPDFYFHVVGISSLRTLRLSEVHEHTTSSPVIISTELRAIPSSLHVFEYQPSKRFSAYGPYEADIVKMFIHLAGQFTVFSCLLPS